MSDIFREVEEEVRQERLQKWWKKYGDYVVAGVSILVIAVAGWKFYQHYEEQQRLKASSQFEAALQMSAAGQNDLAAQAYAQIAKKSGGGYGFVAELAQADELLATGRTKDAVAIYMKLAEKDKQGLGDVARMRAAWAQADALSTEELRSLLAPLNDGKSKWRFMAQELLAYRAYHDGKAEEALQQFTALSKQSEAPSNLRQRAEAMATMLRTSNGNNFGTVPTPVEPAQDAQQGTATP